MLKINIYLSLYLIATVVLMYSCSNEKISATFDESSNSYPLEIGKYWVYEVDSILYSLEGMVVENSTSYVRESITDVLLDSRGDTSYIITRYIKNQLNDPSWTTSDIWTASSNNDLVTKTEENLKFLKLSYPLTLNKSWDGNQFFDQSIQVNIGAETLMPYLNWKSVVTEIEASEVLNDMPYEHVTKIELVSDTSSISLRYGQEWYANDIGLIKKELKILDTQCVSCVGTWEEKAHKGVILNMELIDYN